jgi:hypothetical protein
MPPASAPPSTRQAVDLLDAYFLETRAHLLAVAATLDRVDRAADAPAARADPRYGFLLSALALLQSDVPDRAERIQRLYSKE